ncbi:MFS transporter [Xenorhabdus bovienii]|uniref:MFS transporter n=1 Tax=Xenorhabdus bovienii TaxID=40576 RepID=UPI0023B2E1CF|nr:MFS transporter [Xenorhabdus bovienii]MDE9565187.1 MFS transporter [Xenorhabdus bovienii]
MQKSIFIFLSLLIILYPLGIDLYIISVPELKLQLSANDIEIGRVFSFYLFGVAASLILAGKVTDRFGITPVCIVGSMFFMLASLYCALIPPHRVFEFIIARFAQGVGGGFCYIAALSTVRKICTDQNERMTIYARLNGISCTVPVLAPTLGALLVIGGWQVIFYTMAGVGGILMFLTLGMKRKVKRCKTELAHSSNYLNFTFISMLIASSISLGTVYSYVSISPVVLMGEFGQSIDEYALWMGFFATLSVVTSFGLPYIRRYIGDLFLLIISLLVLSLSGIIANSLLDKNLSIYLFVFSFIGICNSIVFTIALGKALEPYGKSSGEASGILHTCQLLFVSIYIYVSGLFELNPFEMLEYLLIFGGIFSCFIIFIVNIKIRKF